ncbi:protein FAM163A-like [Brachionichthys hirsutus]|uniref:protein FAM163A-like n=1 Tax=Brachionichthys hirsutus TaxID=412623 RepID=UPI003604DBC6
MSAGTIVVSGGILAGVILLCIVAVLCYCRLQYYCCKKSDSEVDVGSDPLSHFPCNACNALAMDGTDISPVSLDQLDSGSHRPACSPFSVRSGLPDGVLNGGERLGFHTYYYNASAPLPLSTNEQGYYSPPLPRPYSTQV